MLNTLAILPPKTASKKYMLVCWIKPLMLNDVINFRAFILNDLSELISSSYIPVIKAIVPPETPGTTLAIPIAIPLIKRVI